MKIDLLVAEIGSTTTKVNAFAGLNSSEPRFLGQGFSRTTVEEGDVNLGLEQALGSGEYQICEALEACVGYKRLLVNIYLPIENGKYTEIDVVMLSETGIFVFESKNYGGWIFGGENSRMWTQVFNSHCKHEFLNPIRQNMGHLKATKKTLAKLRINNNMFHSYIVFGERCNLNNIQYNPLKAGVINLAQLPLTCVC